MKKKARPETNLKSIVPEEYHDFQDVFSKKNSDTLSFYQMFNYKIILKEQQENGYTPLYKISPQKHNVVKCYLNKLSSLLVSDFFFSKSQVEKFDFVLTIGN